MKDSWNKYESFANAENVSKSYQFWSEMFEFKGFMMILQTSYLHFMVLILTVYNAHYIFVTN